VVKDYLGRGPRAEQVAREIEKAKAQREMEERKVSLEAARLAGPNQIAKQALDAICLLVEVILLTNGFHRHNYSSWRKRHVCRDERTATPG
jgi:hypothetical protein